MTFRSDEEMSQILRRAQEIASSEQALLDDQQEWRPIIDAAEEAGLNRDSVMAAIRERLAEQAIEHQPGEIVLAKSPDGHSYPAVFQSTKPSGVVVRYLTGGEGTVPITDIRPFSMIPGMKIDVLSNSYKMWLRAEVIRFNPDSRSITVNCWSSEEVLPLERIRIAGTNKKFPFNIKGHWAIIAGISFGAGATIASILHMIFR
ncbi:tudor domain-containing protein [Kamptonema cortianum]|nr:tudor domain-containing protein [Geitlerinema splendidum]MDK3155859.1 tudor domain-containing protein [Kamptonema cortianum]